MPYSVEDGVREMEVEKALLDEAAEKTPKQLQIQRQEELAREARRLAEEAAAAAAAAAAEQQHEADLVPLLALALRPREGRRSGYGL